MFANLRFLKPKQKWNGTYGSNSRYHVSAEMAPLEVANDYTYIDGFIPVEINKFNIAFDLRPTLNHFLIKREFPVILGPDCIEAKRTRVFDPIARELFAESIHQLKRSRCEFILSALRWPTGIPSLRFIEFFFEDHVFLDIRGSEMDTYLKLLLQASGDPYLSVEDQMIVIYRKILVEAKKLGLTAMDLPGYDLIGDICVVQAARVAKMAAKTINKSDIRLMIYFSLAPAEYIQKFLAKTFCILDRPKVLSYSEMFNSFLETSDSFRRNYLSVSWSKDWPTPLESKRLGEQQKKYKKDKRVTKWLPVFPHFP
ncbi:nonstructural protein [Gordil virus]|uniref:Nonstructural protein n=1 Tax=Gordil virus TaxID=1460451 RepID=W8JJ14_9VIRU|nr:nonstructural protein [Gordil virus]AHK60933.1 nonstructural protein [Gordil virus]